MWKKILPFVPFLLQRCTANGADVCKFVQPTLTPSTPISFTGIIVGRTGSGKSTFINICANGIELAQTGTEDGDSETEMTCVYEFEALREQYVGKKGYKIIDTPGFDDTGGQDLSNQDAVQVTLRRLGKADAIILVFKVDEKYTDEIMSAFLFIRSYFGPVVWKKLIMVYTFFDWSDNCFYGGCAVCKTAADLQAEHAKVMTAAYKYITSLGIGDVRCKKTHDVACFPDAAMIPFIGSDLYLQKLWQYKERFGVDLLNPEDPFYALCPRNSSNAAEQFLKFDRIVTNMTHSPGFVPMDLTQLTNAWVECTKARHGIQTMRGGNQTARHVDFTVYHLKGCFTGSIKSEVIKVRDEILGDRKIQARLAFQLRMPKLINEANGFNMFKVKDLNRYPDYETYNQCFTASLLVPPPIPSVEQTGCWHGLKTASSPPRDIEGAKDDLLRLVQCSCDEPGRAPPRNRFSCSLPEKDWSCADDSACNLGRNWNLTERDSIDVCQILPKCTQDICVADFEVLKTQLPKQCVGMSCTRMECCMRKGMCNSFDCGPGRVQRGDAPAFCGGHSCSDDECCQQAPKCTPDVCISPMEVPKPELPQFCVGGACTRKECCTSAELCSDYTCETGWIIDPNRPTFCKEHQSFFFFGGTDAGCTQNQCCQRATSCDDSVCDVDEYKPKADPPRFCEKPTCALDECCKLRPTCNNYQCGDGYHPKSGGVCYGRSCQQEDCCSNACQEIYKYASGICDCSIENAGEGGAAWGWRGSCRCGDRDHCFKQHTYKGSPRCYAELEFEGDCDAGLLLAVTSSTRRGRQTKKQALQMLSFGCALGGFLGALVRFHFLWRPPITPFGQALLSGSAQSQLVA